MWGVPFYKQCLTKSAATIPTNDPFTLQKQTLTSSKHNSSNFRNSETERVSVKPLSNNTNCIFNLFSSPILHTHHTTSAIEWGLVAALREHHWSQFALIQQLNQIYHWKIYPLPLSLTYPPCSDHSTGAAQQHHLLMPIPTANDWLALQSPGKIILSTAHEGVMARNIK